MNQIKQILSYRLKSFRFEHGLSQEEAAEKFNISLQYYGRIERGTVPGKKTLLSIYDILGCTFSEILNDMALHEKFTVDGLNDKQVEDIMDILNCLCKHPEIITCIKNIVYILNQSN